MAQNGLIWHRRDTVNDSRTVKDLGAIPEDTLHSYVAFQDENLQLGILFDFSITFFRTYS